MIRKGRYFICVILLSFFFLPAYLLLYKYKEVNCKIGVIKNKDVCVYAIPNQDAHKKSMLKKSSVVLIDQQIDSWYKIKKGVVNGWVQNHNIISVY